MNTVKTTLFANQANRAVYFDIEENIETYEKMTGKKLSKRSAELIRCWGPIVNRAYEDGVRDGKEAMNV